MLILIQICHFWTKFVNFELNLSFFDPNLSFSYTNLSIMVQICQLWYKFVRFWVIILKLCSKLLDFNLIELSYNPHIQKYHFHHSLEGETWDNVNGWGSDSIYWYFEAGMKGAGGSTHFILLDTFYDSWIIMIYFWELRLIATLVWWKIFSDKIKTEFYASFVIYVWQLQHAELTGIIRVWIIGCFSGGNFKILCIFVRF